MSWFVIALLGTLLWSVGNFVDKLLSDRFSGHLGGAWSLALFSSFFSSLVIIGLVLWQPQVLFADLRHVLILMLAGTVEITGIFLYLRALRHEDTSTVVPFFQVVPFFSFALGYIILGEVLSLTQTLAGLVVIIGGVILSLDLSAERHVRIKASLVGMMLLSSFCFALFDALFKFGALDEGFWTAIFWQHVGVLIPGILVFFFHAHAREGFAMSLEESRFVTLGLNFLNEVLYVGGVTLFVFALTLAPIALVATVNVFQPVFVFVFGTLLTILFPRFIRENVSHRHLAHKTLAIALIVTASIFLIS